MTISFKDVPTDSRVPFIYVEIDGSQAQQGPSLQPYQMLVIGQRLAAGTVAEKVPQLVTSLAQAIEFFGAGSVLAQMAELLFLNNRSTLATFIALDDPAGAQAEGELTVTGAATAAGTVAVYVAGRRVQVGVATGDTATEVGDAIAAAINANTNLPVTAANVAGVVTVTAKHAGVVGNDILLELNKFQGETNPAGVAIALEQMGVTAAGTGNATVDATLWAALGDEHYNVLAVGLSAEDAPTLTAFEIELDDRFGPVRQIDGHAFFGLRETFANAITLGSGRNSAQLSIRPANGSPSSPWEWAAAAAAVVARYGKQDPARPFQTLPLVGIQAPPITSRFTLLERDQLLRNGMSTFTVAADGTVAIEREITTYQTNPAGAPDTAFLDVNTKLTLSYLRYDARNRFKLRFPRHKLADDGTRFGAGQAILTPKIARAELLGYFRQWEELGLVEGFDQFKADLIVERSSTDPNRLDIMMPPDLVNQLRVVGASIRFLL